MKKLFSAVLVAGVLALGGAFAQVNTSALQAQVQTVERIIQMTEAGKATRADNLVADYPYLLTEGQVEALLPYLREVNALSALTQADADFYAAKIAAILTDAQRGAVGGLSGAAVGSSAPAISGGGSSGPVGLEVAANPLAAGDGGADLGAAITYLTNLEHFGK